MRGPLAGPRVPPLFPTTASMTPRPPRRTSRFREAHAIQLTTLGKTAAGIAVACAIASRFAILAAVRNVFRTFRAFAVGASETTFLALNYVSGACLLLGATGLLLRKTWGWWACLAGAVIGLGDMARLFSGLFAIINPDHPEAAVTTALITQMISGPALLYLGLVVVLCLRPLRETYRVSSPPRTRRRAAEADGDPDTWRDPGP